MLSAEREDLFEGTWSLLQGQDDRECGVLARIVLRDGVAWYSGNPSAVGYYEVAGTRIVIGLPRGDAGLDLITAKLLGDPGKRELSGIIESTDGDDRGVCDPCVLLGTGGMADRRSRFGRGCVELAT